MAAAWTTYDTSEGQFLAEQARRDGLDRELVCPACSERRVRTYRYFSSRTTGPTVISYAWCANCHRYQGGTGPRPPSLSLDDPLDQSDHERYDHDLFGLLAYLDRLWEEGVLPQKSTR